MGQAKLRGTFEQRKLEGIERLKLIAETRERERLARQVQRDKEIIEAKSRIPAQLQEIGKTKVVRHDAFGSHRVLSKSGLMVTMAIMAGAIK